MMRSPRLVRRWCGFTRAMVTQAARTRLRSMPQLPQLRQIRVSRSTARDADPRKNEALHGGSLRAAQPLAQLAFSKSPLAADFDRGNLAALGPQAHRPGRNAEPLRYR